jgi:hypothetical protein
VVTLGTSISLDALNHHDRLELRRARREEDDPRDPRSPPLYDVSVRTTPFPKGAARGQLKRTA